MAWSRFRAFRVWACISTRRSWNATAYHDDEMISFHQKVALITGAAQGIGRGIAEAFADAGASVALFDVNGEGAREAANRISPHGKALAISGDVAREDDVGGACERVFKHFGSLDVVVNNAGIETGGSAVNLALSVGTVSWRSISAELFY